jgi:uncharacterized membrane protein
MTARAQQLAAEFFHCGWDELTAAEQRVLERAVSRVRVSHDTNREFAEQSTVGERVSDRVAAFGGSWYFIIGFFVVLICWISLNTMMALRHRDSFDPYPFILLNLLLSMVAAFQAPVILMSQNRQSAKDRLDAAHDYQVNLKAEIEIRTLHDKLDQLREHDWEVLLGIQQEQIALLRRLVDLPGAGASA